MIAITTIRKSGFCIRVLGIIGLIGLMGTAPPILFAQQTQSDLQASLAMQDKVVLQQDEAVDEELKQVIELNLTNASIEQALQEIAWKTDLKLMYSEALLPQEKKVTLHSTNITLYSALWKVLDGTGLRFGLSQNRQLVLLKMQESRSLEAVQETITGTVTDAESGDPLPAVNVSVKGTTIGTSTNAEGNYELTVPSLQDTLVFSFIGYRTREIPIEGRTDVDIQMASQTVEGDELVVTAFGLEREKKSLGYSTQELSGESLAEAREMNVASGLKGKVAGVQISQSPSPGGSTGIIIRGVGSLTGNNQPLIIVDGVPIDNQALGGSDAFSGRDYGDGIGNINPDDIEELSVLKGPNAAALYGARAANGAIIITTKSGRSGGGIGVTLNTNFTFDQFGVFPTFQNKYAPGYSPNISDWGTITYNGQEYPLYNGAVDNWGPLMDGTEVILPGMQDLGPVPLTPQPEDNIKEFFETGVTLNNTLAVDGGEAKTTYRFSVSDVSNQGVVPNSKYDRNSFSLRLTSDITDRLKVDGKANYIHTKGENRPEMGTNLGAVLPNMLFFPRSIDFDWLKNYKDEEGNYRNYKPSGYPLNPYWLVNEVQNEDTRSRIIGFVSAEYNFTDWLSLMVRTGLDTYIDERMQRISHGTPRGGYENGYISNLTYNVQEINSDILLTANQDLSEDIDLRVSVGGNRMYRETEITGNTGQNLDMEGLYHISNAADVNPRYYLSRKEIQSVFVMGQIGFKDYLFLDASGRNDWSSTLGVNNRSFFYPATSLSFVFSDAFHISSSIFTYGSVRASYAQTGVDADPYQTQQGYSISNNTTVGQREGSIGNQIALLNLKNELTKSFEIGTDIRLFNNRLGVDLTYYDAATYNQIFPVNISSASGFNSRLINAGEVQNSGFELTINAMPVQTGSFSWSVNFNYSSNNSEIVSLANDVDTHTLYPGAGVVNIEARPGEPYGNIIGYEYKRNDAGDIVLDDGGRPQRADERSVLGNIQPDWLGGLTNTVRFKGFSLSALLDIRQGGEMYSFSKYDQTAKGTGKFTENRDNLIFPGVIENEDGSYSPSDIDLAEAPFEYYAMHAWGNIGEYFVVDQSFISLREVTLGYTFPLSFIEKTPLRSLEISVVGRNLLYLQRDETLELMGISPESYSDRNAASIGYEARNMPLTRSIGFNLNVKF